MGTEEWLMQGGTLIALLVAIRWINSLLAQVKRLEEKLDQWYAKSFSDKTS